MALNEEGTKPHIAILPSPGMGHVIPLVITTADPLPTAMNNLLRSTPIPSGLHVIDLPPVDLSDILSEIPPGLARFFAMVKHSIQLSLRPVLLGLTRPMTLVIDLFCTQAFEICNELSILVYSFFTASAAFLAFSDPFKYPFADPYPLRIFQIRLLIKFHDENFKFTSPLIKEDEPISELDDDILTWLDKQKPDSVLFIALGSGGTLSSKQLIELAFGLELSQQRFVFVVRTPMGAFYSPAYLPEGFVKRTEGVGLVMKSWAPQVAVLKHASAGGFLSHCGWNSALESVAHGVPIITWPLYAEERMNATHLAEVGVAVKPMVELGKEVVEREEIERVVKLVMEGDELRDSARIALDSGGSSYDPLARTVKARKLEHNTTT